MHDEQEKGDKVTQLMEGTEKVRLEDFGAQPCERTST